MWATSQNNTSDNSSNNNNSNSSKQQQSGNQHGGITPEMRKQLYAPIGTKKTGGRDEKDDGSSPSGSGGKGGKDDITNERLEELCRAVWDEDDDDDVVPSSRRQHQYLGNGFQTPTEGPGGLMGSGGRPPVAMFATPPTQGTHGLSKNNQQSKQLPPHHQHHSSSHFRPSVHDDYDDDLQQGSREDEENLGTVRRTPEFFQQLKSAKQHHMYSGAGATSTTGGSGGWMASGGGGGGALKGSTGTVLRSSAASFRSSGMTATPPPVDSSFGSFTVTSHDDDDCASVSLKPGQRRGLGTPQQQQQQHQSTHGFLNRHAQRFDPMAHFDVGRHANGSGHGGSHNHQHLQNAETIHELTPTNIVHVRDMSWRAQGPSKTSNKYKVFIQNLEPKTTKQDLMQIFFPFGGAEAEIQPFCPPGARRQGICYFSSELLAVSGASKLNNFVPHGQTQPLLCAYDDEPWGEEPPPGSTERKANTITPSSYFQVPQESTPGMSSSAATLHNASATTVRSNSSSEMSAVESSIHSATMAALNPNHGGEPYSGSGSGGGSTRYAGRQQQQQQQSQSYHRGNNDSGAGYYSDRSPTMPGAAGTLGQGKALHYALQAAGLDPSTHWSTSNTQYVPPEHRHPTNPDLRDGSTCLRLLLQKTPGIPQRQGLVNDIFDQFLAVSENTSEISALTKVMLEHLKYHQQEGMRLLRHLIHKFNEPQHKRLRSRYLDPLSRPIVSVLLTSNDKPERIGVAIVVADLFECGFIGGTPFGMARKLAQPQVEGTAARKDPDLIDALVSMTTAWASNHTDRKPTEDEQVFCNLVSQHYKAMEQELLQLQKQRQQSNRAKQATPAAEGRDDDNSDADNGGNMTPRGQQAAGSGGSGPDPHRTPTAFEQQQMSEEDARRLAAMTTPPCMSTLHGSITNSPSGGGGDHMLNGNPMMTPLGAGTHQHHNGGDGEDGTPNPHQLSTPGNGGAHAKLDEDIVACTVYITRVPPGTAEAKLRNIFCECGEINKVRLYEDKQSRGAFGFVEFSTPIAATKMIRLNDRRHVDSSRMRCNAARNAIHDSDTRDAIVDHITGARIRDCLFGLSAKPQNTMVRTTRGVLSQ